MDYPYKFRDLFSYKEIDSVSKSFIIYKNIKLHNPIFGDPEYNWLIMSLLNGTFYMWKNELNFDEKKYCFGADFII